MFLKNIKLNTMKAKRIFDLIFIIVSALLLTALSQYGFLEKHVSFLLIPVLIAYYLGKFCEAKFRK